MRCCDHTDWVSSSLLLSVNNVGNGHAGWRDTQGLIQTEEPGGDQCVTMTFGSKKVVKGQVVTLQSTVCLSSCFPCFSFLVFLIYKLRLSCKPGTTFWPGGSNLAELLGTSSHTTAGPSTLVNPILGSCSCRLLLVEQSLQRANSYCRGFRTPRSTAAVHGQQQGTGRQRPTAFVLRFMAETKPFFESMKCKF